ncbi:14402_t:CDS:2, partial [Gigaspora rosea]
MDKMQKDGKLNSESTLKIKSNLDFKICSCKQKVLKDDWEDHQIVCPKRRLTCPAFVSFLSATSKFEQPYWKIYGERYAEFSLPLVESNCNLEKLKTSRVPSAIIHTLRWECPTFSTKAELNKHLALDPISQRLPSTPNIFPYHCSLCDHYFLNSDTHICMPSPPIPEYNILCHGCKSKVDQPRRTPYELENACQVCYNPDNNFLNSDTHPIPEYDIICHGCKSKLDQPKKTDYELENTCQVCCNQDNNNPIVIGMVGMNIIKSDDKIHGTEA